MSVAEAPRDYASFLARKAIEARPCGIAGGDNLPEALYPFQRDTVEWALAQGRPAIFADCGLGKTPMQLAWALEVWRHTRGRVLILAPLAVAQQTRLEGAKFGIGVNILRERRESYRPGLYVTNYQRLHHFTDAHWDGLVLDESSILKAFDGKTRQTLIEFAKQVPYRLCATATPSPNDYIEFGGHAEFLGVLSAKQMLAMFFVNDGIHAASWRLKGHAGGSYWTWLSSWARAARSPADLGYQDDRFRLPPLNVELHTVDADSVSEDRLFSVPASTLTERRDARRESLSLRVGIAADLVNASADPWVVWCDLNAESGALARAIPDSVEVRGSDSIEEKEARLLAFTNGDARVIVTKPSIGGHGLNWQHCANVCFVGLSDSYEAYYQAVRRCWRYGQTKPVRVVVIASRREQAVLDNIARKEKQAGEMFDQLIAAQGLTR